MPVTRLETLSPSGTVIGLDHFGVNFIDAYEPATTDNQTSPNFLGLDDILDDLGPVTARWPGGSDIETYALSLGSSGVDLIFRDADYVLKDREAPLDMASLDSFLAALSTESGARAIIELPTFWLVAPTPDKTDAYGKDASITEPEASAKAELIQAFVQRVLQMANGKGVEIAGFEIGNEYRGYYSASGYAGILNATLDDVRAGIDDSGVTQREPPQIIVQIDDFGNNRTPAELAARNQRILDDLHPDARELVGAVAIHYYFDEGEMPGTSTEWQETYDRIDDWVAAFAAMGDAWSTPNREVEVTFTEWGVSRLLPGTSSVASHIETLNFGMMAMAPTLEIFSQALQRGADALSIWPTRSHATGLYNDGGAHRPLGALFDIMADTLIDKQAIEVNVGAQQTFDVHAFLGWGEPGQTNATAFVSSLTDQQQTITLLLEDLHALPGGHVQVQVIEVIPETVDGEFRRDGTTYTGFTAWSDPDARAAVRSIFVADLTNPDGSISLALDAYEVAVVRYEAFDRVVRLAGGNFNGTEGDEQVFGDDVANVVALGAGRDWARGADGDDNLTGGAGDDTLLGDDGNDSLFGGTQVDGGNDDLFGDSVWMRSGVLRATTVCMAVQVPTSCMGVQVPTVFGATTAPTRSMAVTGTMSSTAARPATC